MKTASNALNVVGDSERTANSSSERWKERRLKRRREQAYGGEIALRKSRSVLSVRKEG